MFKIFIIVCLGFFVNGVPVDNNDKRLLKDVNPEFLGGGYEGDMLFPEGDDLTRGVAMYGAPRRWPSRIIPYNISAITNAADRDLITRAMNKLMYDVGTPIINQTSRQICVRFRPAQAGDTNILKIQYGNGCNAITGFYSNFPMTLNLQPVGCFQSGIIQHELTHVLGFYHEQSRPDRDSYITIHAENIETDMEHNFKKYVWGTDVESQGFAYDYGSLMHYPSTAFSKNGRPTITPRQSNAAIGQREKLSPTDIAEIRHYYGCK